MAVALELTYTVTDAKGAQSTTTINVPTGFSLPQYTEFAAGMATLIDTILRGRVSGADLCVAADISGLALNIPPGDDDVEEVASFVFATSEGRRVSLNIPGAPDNIAISGSDDLNTDSNASVQAVVNMMTNGIAVTGGTIQPCDVGEDDIVLLIEARERFRSSGTRKD